MITQVGAFFQAFQIFSKDIMSFKVSIGKQCVIQGNEMMKLPTEHTRHEANSVLYAGVCSAAAASEG